MDRFTAIEIGAVKKRIGIQTTYSSSDTQSSGTLLLFSMLDQSDQVTTSMSSRGREPVAISWYDVQICDAVPGDCRVACRLLAMTAVDGRWFF